jgi:hypothetical protein
MYVFRLGMLRPSAPQLRKLLRSDSVYVRAVALLWARFSPRAMKVNLRQKD